MSCAKSEGSTQSRFSQFNHKARGSTVHVNRLLKKHSMKTRDNYTQDNSRAMLSAVYFLTKYENGEKYTSHNVKSYFLQVLFPLKTNNNDNSIKKYNIVFSSLQALKQQHRSDYILIFDIASASDEGSDQTARAVQAKL